jgi:hypothetical protein
LHMLLASRPALVNSANVTHERGDLVLEGCHGLVTRAHAIDVAQRLAATSMTLTPRTIRAASTAYDRGPVDKRELDRIIMDEV